MSKNKNVFFLILQYFFSVLFCISSTVKAESNEVRASNSTVSEAKTTNPNPSNCLSDESLLAASTLASCSENSALGDCWSFSNNGKLISLGFAGGIVAGNLKAWDDSRKVRESMRAVDTNPRTIMGVPNATNYETFLKNQLAELQYSHSTGRSEKKFQYRMDQAIDHLKNHLRSIGLDDKTMSEKIEFEKKRIQLLKERTRIESHIKMKRMNQAPIQDSEWQALKTEAIQNNEEILKLNKNLKITNRIIEASGMITKNRLAIKAKAKGALMGLLAGVALERVKNHFTIKAIQRTYPGTSEEEASRLSSLLIHESGVAANQPDDFSIAASTLDELLQHPLEERQKAIQINPHLCQVIDHQKKKFFEQASHYTNVQAQVLSGDHGQTRFLMNLGDGNYEAVLEKNKFGTPTLTSTLMPGRLDQTNSRRTFNISIDPQTGEFGSIRTEHIGARSAFSNRNALDGTPIIPIKDYTRIMAKGNCRWMDPTVEYGSHFVSQADQIGCNVARVTQAINYKFQEIMEACSSDTQNPKAPVSPAKDSSNATK